MSHAVTDSHRPNRKRTAAIAASIKWASIAIAIIAFVAALRGMPVAQGFEAAVSWVEGRGPLAPIAFAGIYFLATMLLLPAWPLSVAAGALFGLFMGSAVVIAGATAGAAGAFILTRCFARAAVERKLKHYPRFAAVDRAVGKGGWRIVLLLRLSPAFPFTLQNYLYGLTAIRFWPCMLATAAGIVPGVFLYVYFGVAGRAGLRAASGEIDGGWAQTTLLVVGLIATVVVTVYITRLARDAIQKQGELAPPDETPLAKPPASVEKPWRGAVFATIVAIAMVILAGCVHNPPAFLMRLFGPPAVAMTEAFAINGAASFDRAPFKAVVKRHAHEAGRVESFLARSFEPMADALEAGRMPRLRWLEYDRPLNAQENLP